MSEVSYRNESTNVCGNESNSIGIGKESNCSVIFIGSNTNHVTDLHFSGRCQSLGLFCNTYGENVVRFLLSLCSCYALPQCLRIKKISLLKLIEKGLNNKKILYIFIMFVCR